MTSAWACDSPQHDAPSRYLDAGGHPVHVLDRFTRRLEYRRVDAKERGAVFSLGACCRTCMDKEMATRRKAVMLGQETMSL